ncbi:hypothetical protein CR513_21727, partial [Mucuna pruriens]
MVERDDIIVVVISQANIMTNVVDFGATQHICASRNVFSSYTFIGDGEELVYLGDSRTTSVIRKGKVMLKLIFDKNLALSDVLHVHSIRVLVALSGKVGVEVSFESGKIVMTKNNGLFVLNIYETFSENASSSTYIINLCDIWHARLGHTNFSYKSCPFVQCEYEPYCLIHFDLADLKQTIHKDEAFNMFLAYKAEVENQLNNKIKRIILDHIGVIRITHEVTPPYSPESDGATKFPLHLITFGEKPFLLRVSYKIGYPIRQTIRCHMTYEKDIKPA